MKNLKQVLVLVFMTLLFTTSCSKDEGGDKVSVKCNDTTVNGQLSHGPLQFGNITITYTATPSACVASNYSNLSMDIDGLSMSIVRGPGSIETPELNVFTGRYINAGAHIIEATYVIEYEDGTWEAFKTTHNVTF